jgi:PAS domain S-box-containing protein
VEFFSNLINPDGFMPRWKCGAWSDGLGMTHIAADLACTAAYITIPCVLAYFIWRRRDLAMPRAARRVAWFFVVVFLACAAVHGIEALIFWEPIYRASAVAKVFTAVISWVTVIALIPLVPQAMALKSPAALEREVEQRRQLESALKESEALYASLVESLPLNVFRKDLEGRIVFANGRLYDTLALTAEQLIGKSDHDLFPKELADKYRSDDLQVIEQGKFIDEVEQHFVGEENELAYVQVLKAPVRNAEGQIVGVQGMFWDVSDRHRAEVALDQERQLLHSLLENIPDAIYFKDANSKFLRVNRAVANLIGVDDPAEAVGKSDHDYFTQEAADAFRADELRILETGEPVLDKEESQILPNGRQTWTTTTKMPLCDPEGKRIGTFGISREITDRKLADIEIRENAERLAKIIDTAYDAFVAMDEHGNVVDWNPQAERTFGWKRDEVVGKSVAEAIVPEEFHRAHLEGIRRFQATGQGVILNRRIEVQARHRDGRQFPVELTVAPSPLGDGTVFNAFLHDITDRKHAEAELHQAKEAAEAANFAKSLFLANMSHEIRTPMNGILGMTDLVLDTELAPEQREYLRMVKDSGESLMTVIEDILDFSKIEAGRLELEHVMFDLRENLGDTMRSLAFRAHGKGLELAVHVDPAVPETLVGDPRRLRQIVVNLVGNAVKFTDHGEVVLEVECRSQLDENVVLHLSVSDTGVGIPPEKQDTIFAAFEQADNSTTRRFGGTGLGLAISSRLVELMGGRIWVESKQGSGSTFHFTVLFGVAQEPAARRPSRTDAKLPGARVLVVDDNATNRRIVEEMLANWGLRSVASPSAADALRLIEIAEERGERFDLILTDSHMPHQDGFSLIEQIRGLPGPRDSIIMMLTSGDHPNDISRCEALNVATYLVKPIKQSELFDAIVLALNITTVEDEQPHSGAAATDSGRPLRILLAEDSLVNQKLAVGLLEKWGHSVFVANNGSEAVVASQAEPFDLVIMDVQMPEMDGLEATETIRSREQSTGAHVPILAMTAHAMKGDRERCLASGMDDYISKPIRAGQLQETIHRLLGGETSKASAESAAESDDVMNWSAALDAVQGDYDLLRVVIEAFLSEYPDLVAQLRESLENRDSVTMQRAAHTLKGSMRYFGAARAFDLALKLETMGRGGRTEGAHGPLSALEGQLERMRPLLEAFVQQGKPPQLGSAPGDQNA